MSVSMSDKPVPERRLTVHSTASVDDRILKHLPVLKVSDCSPKCRQLPNFIG